MLTDTSRWSHARGNEVVPYRWQATLLMILRLRSFVLPRAFKVGLLTWGVSLAGNTVLFLWDIPERDPDLALSTLVLAVTVGTRFEWARLVPASYRVGGEDGDLVAVHRQVGLLLSVSVGFVLFLGLEWLIF